MQTDSLKITLETLQPERQASAEPRNRLCIAISDVHFTDGTVGTQNAEATAWKDFFSEIVSTCREDAIDDLTLLLVGDVADMIRTAIWAQEGVYPWERTHANFPLAPRKIMHRIAGLHAGEPGQSAGHDSCGFFHHLQNLPAQLAGVRVETIVLLGNHDKEILADPEVLTIFYERCLGRKVVDLSTEYRRWIGRMYGDEKRFADPSSVPWLPFYWGDADLRLFVTHGQWRDPDNSRAVEAQGNLPAWQVGDGWRADVWQKLDYRPFTDPCFGDTVAAGVLSTFIYQAKRKLANLPDPELPRLMRILDELDLYRPSSAAVSRILQETRRGRISAKVRDIIEAELYQAISDWLSWDFTLESSPPARRFALQAARIWLKLTGPLRWFRIQLTLVWLILEGLNLIEKLKPLSIYREDGASFKDIKTFPTYQQAFWEQGFRLHGEGHTHVPLESDAKVEYTGQDSVLDKPNFSYINFGTWRDQIVDKENGGYRRRGVGRALFVQHLQKEHDKSKRYRYFVQDGIQWSDRMDQW